MKIQQIRKRIEIPRGMRAAIVATVTVTSLLLGVRQFGGLQPLELVAFDRLLSWRPPQKPDPRLLIVEVNEADINNLQQWPPTDETLARVFEILQQHQPTVIGLDLVRDISYSPGKDQLAAQLSKPNVIGITTIGNTHLESIPPPPSIPKERIGFNDISSDPDGRLRRNLMFASYQGITLISFSLQLALLYLENRGISPQVTENNKYQLGDVVFSQLKPNSGGYQKIDARGYQILLSYRSLKVARQITITQVLEEEFDPSWVRDKIVLIGATAPSLKDLFFTPYSAIAGGHSKMSGVEIHAQMVSQYLSAVLDRRRLFWFWPEGLEVLWIFGWALAGGVVAWKLEHPVSLGLGAIALLGSLGGIGYAIILQQGWVPIAAPALASMLTGTGVVVRQVQVSWQQQKMVMRLLGQQTSPEIASALWQARDRLLQEGRLPWQMVTATVLFTDLKGYSSVAERRSPLELMAWLNQYQEAMTEVVLHHQGIVKDFTGDGMRAVFGVPVPRTTPEAIARDAENAVCCGLAMGDRLSQLNEQWQQEGLPAVQMRVGIFTGPVAVGSLGSKHRLEYGVIGDSVNIASRLESYEKERHEGVCRVLIARETLEHLGEKFQVESWGNLTLRGRKQPVEVFLAKGDRSID